MHHVRGRERWPAEQGRARAGQLLTNLASDLDFRLSDLWDSAPPLYQNGLVACMGPFPTSLPSARPTSAAHPLRQAKLLVARPRLAPPHSAMPPPLRPASASAPALWATAGVAVWNLDGAAAAVR
ncbi:Protein of unknown function [Gryllus bimaculatus]|nr:Protein of unknown function [Gryllus bimaculatus]